MSGQGGFWNAPQVVYSKQTHDLLKDMMRESKLTTFQQRHLEKTLRGGGSLPSRVPPTTSKLDHRAPKVIAPAPKVLNPKGAGDPFRVYSCFWFSVPLSSNTVLFDKSYRKSKLMTSSR
ncbi:UPF0193 protein EVG1-like [Elysia marginata]|uniref:UPF0193 protein EVG1-like n=1 Tax=Elysia marginata TaxID=1093978 RepID=A0AAV4G5E5_9GAST|nr:UPF0193 protein EVG1-like [Elysia marginata]